jgi:glycosyltransferase involved in cell wall biosynthesis
VLVVDNGSTDATPEVVARHAAAGTLALRTVREAEPA